MITKSGNYKGGKTKDMTGMKVGRLTVISPAGILKHHEMYWNCICDCGNKVVVSGASLRRENGRRSCGCLHREAFQKYRKWNEYTVDGDVVKVLLDNKNKEMLCDIEDWERLKEYRWRVGRNGYAETTSNGVVTPFHHFIIGCEKGNYRDHINRNRLDNRKENLREVTPFESVLNRGINKNNTSGYRGVTYSKRYKKWVAQISHNRKNHILGRFDRKEDAIAARKAGEVKYFGREVS